MAVASWAERATLPPFALVGDGDAGVGRRAGPVRQVHRHAEALPGHRHAAPAGRLGCWCCWRCSTRRSAAPAGAVAWPARLAPGARRRWCCRSRWAAGSAPTMRCWPAAAFPQCNGQWWPPDGLRPGLHAAARTGPHGRRASCLPFEALVAIHWAHRVFARGGRARARRCWRRCPGRCTAAWHAAAPRRCWPADAAAAGHGPVQRGAGLAPGGGAAAQAGAAALVLVLTLLLARARWQPARCASRPVRPGVAPGL
jgi:hypothetical protein